jgi:hypothetical protein
VSASLAGVARGSASHAPQKRCQLQWKYLHEFIQLTDACYKSIAELIDVDSLFLQEWLENFSTASKVRRIGLLKFRDILHGHVADDAQDILCVMLIQHAMFELLRRRNDTTGDLDSAFASWDNTGFTESERSAIKIISDKLLPSQGQPSAEHHSYPGLQSLSDSPVLQYSGTQFHGNSPFPISVTNDSLEEEEQPGQIEQSVDSTLLNPTHENFWQFGLDLQSPNSPNRTPFQPQWLPRLTPNLSFVAPYDTHGPPFSSNDPHRPASNFAEGLYTCDFDISRPEPSSNSPSGDEAKSRLSQLKKTSLLKAFRMFLTGRSSLPDWTTSHSNH